MAATLVVPCCPARSGDLKQGIHMATRSIAWLFPLALVVGAPVYAAEPSAEVTAAPNGAVTQTNAQAEDDVEARTRKTPDPRDPTRGMYDPHTDREGDARSLEQLSRDRLNIDGKRSRSLNDLASPLRERRSIDQARGRLGAPNTRSYGTSTLRDRLDVQDSRRDYRIDSSRDLREEYIDEHGAADSRVYRTR